MENKKLSDKYLQCLDYIKKNKLEKAVVIALIGIILIVSGSFFKFGSDTKPSKEIDTNYYAMKKNIEQDLEKLINKIDGVKNASVYVTIDDKGEDKIAYEQAIQTKEEEADIDFKSIATREQGKESPKITKTLLPKIRGVSVVAKGVDDSVVKVRVYNSVKAALNIELYKIEVVPSAK